MKSLLENVQFLMVNFDANLLVSGYAITNLRQAVLRDVNDINKEIGKCMSELQSTKSKTSDALGVLSSQITQ